MNQTAIEFLTRCFAPGETVAILLRRENPASAEQRIIAFERAITPRYLAWLGHENGAGANIYVAANPLRPSSRKRTKESIASVRHLYIDIDTDGDARLAALRVSKTVPTPTAILSTSPSKYQVLWRVDGFDFERQEQTLKLLAIEFGGDPACTDCNRVLRIPGFLNRKYDPAHQITVEYPTAIPSGLPVISGSTLQRSMRRSLTMLCLPESSPESTATPRWIGPGFVTSLPTVKTPRS